MIVTDRQPLTWLITGADKGLGLNTARTALERGDQVVVTVLAADGQHPLAAEYPDRFRSIHLDARDHARVPEVVAEAERAFGRIDVLVNNAGYGLIGVIEATPPEKYRPMFEVNFFGLAAMTGAVLPIMRRQRSGHIINLSSHGGYSATAGFGFYCASKFAVEGYSESLAQEVAEFGIHVTIIEPGGFRSDFAGPSLVSETGEVSDAYSAVIEKVVGYSDRRHGTQPNDPAKFGQALCRLVDLQDPPLRLPLGEDALVAIGKDTRNVLAELDRWAELSASTKFDS